MEEKRQFTSRLSRGQTILTLVWLPVHVLLMPLGAALLWQRGMLGEIGVNVLIYAVSALVLLLVLGSFFRRDFDPLCDRPLQTLLNVVIHYGMLLGGNMIVAGGMMLFGLADNPNNEAAVDLVRQSFGPMAGVTIFLAPIVEESLFRAGVFGALRRKSRWAAYAVSTLLFGLCHVWSFALLDPKELVYLLQYIPAGLALARCYERTDSVWGSIFLHMLNNAVSLWAVLAVG